MQPANRTTISVHPSCLQLKFVNIGYGNPRYNSLIVCPDDTVIIPCGSTLRKVDLRNNQIVFNKQIGTSQIFQILQNDRWIMVVNFEGLITLLNKDSLVVEKQFRAGSKQTRHSSISSQYIALSLQLNDGTEQARLEIYSVADILKQEGAQIQVKPIYCKMGYYYYPQLIGKQLIFIEYNDPNPKGRSRTETVMNKKLPVKHRVLSLNLQKLEQADHKQIYGIKFQGQILCAVHNSKTRQIFYLHQSKKLTILWLNTYSCLQMQVKATAVPHCIESYKMGIIFCSKTNELTYLQYPKQKQELKLQSIEVATKGLTTSYAIKSSTLHADNFIFFNQNGLQYFDSQNGKMYTQNCFDITNCGISLNKSGTHFAVADFGGNIYIFTTQDSNVVPQPVKQVCIGMPVRSLTWCHDTGNIIVGCVGGYLYKWNEDTEQAEFISQTNDHTINIVRYYSNFVIFGTSDGFVHIMSSQTLQQLYRFQAHKPIQYENEKDKQLFGSMKNYAQIWSIVAYPTSSSNIFNLVTCSEDQTQKVFAVEVLQTGQCQHSQLHHLVGHSLAVTSIDWKQMKSGLGVVYVSCSDDKIVRFRNPQKMFEVIHQLETSTIKEWHTLTYLALQENGHRVAIGSQNGYLFVFDIESKALLYGEKIHLGGIQGMDWRNGKLITCSSDLCLSVITV